MILSSGFRQLTSIEVSARGPDLLCAPMLNELVDAGGDLFQDSHRSSFVPLKNIHDFI